MPFDPSPLPTLAAIADSPDGFIIAVVDSTGAITINRWQAGDESREASRGTWSGPWTLLGVTAVGPPTLRALGDGAVDLWVRDDRDQLRHTTVGADGEFRWAVANDTASHDPHLLSNGLLVTRGVQGKLGVQSTSDLLIPLAYEWGCTEPLIFETAHGFQAIGVTPDGSEMRHYTLEYSRAAGHHIWTRRNDPAGPGPLTGLIGLSGYDRYDLFGSVGGNIVHWGLWALSPEWFRDDPADGGRPWFDTPVINDELAPGPGVDEIVGRDTAARPVIFRWDDAPGDEQGVWRRSLTLDEPADQLPVALTSPSGREALVALSSGVLTLWFRSQFDLGGWAVTQFGVADTTWDSEALRYPDHFLRRPDDLLLLGITRSAGSDRTVSIILPPQHLGEETVPSSETLAPGGTRRGIPSGPSELVFQLAEPADTQTISETLAALGRQGATISESGTVLELPRGVAVAPAEGGVSMRHATGPEVSGDGVVGLWVGRLEWPDGSTGSMRVRGADLSVDGFAVPVNRAVRSILRQIPPEDTTFARLDVSALGATFHALASGGGFRWEQHAVLGRDERVTTQWRGVLLPFGHKVLYTEDTLRGTSEFEGEGHHEWIAALRMTGTLTILEHSVDTSGLTLFPFDRIDLLDGSVPPLDKPDWVFEERTVNEQDLQETLYRVESELAHVAQANSEWFLPEWQWPLIETQTLLSDEWPPPGDEQASYLWLMRAAVVLRRSLGTGTLRDPVPVAFIPHRDGAPYRFRIRAHHDGGPLEFTMPLVFVSDVDLPAVAGVLERFTTIGHPDVLETAMKRLGESTVTIPTTSLRLNGRGADQEVRVLHFGARVEGAAFVPRLGAGVPDRDGKPDWIAEIGLPAVRGLTGDDRGARVDYPHESDPADVLLRPVESVIVDFARHADRIGALATPSYAIAVISKELGPAPAAAIGAVPDLSALLGEGARLLGVDLRALTKDVTGTPPNISHTLPATYSWGPVKLTSAGPLQAKDASTLAISVEAQPAGPKVLSTLTQVDLALPPGAALFTVSFDEIVFDQPPGASPDLRVRGVTASFGKDLSLLSGLAKLLAQATLAPAVAVDAHGVRVGFVLPVPEVACGAFRMSDATFAAGIDIPFSPPGVRLTLQFASKERPCTLGVLAFSGGGFMRAVLSTDEVSGSSGIEELEIGLEFGASLAVNLGVARAEVHALGGVTALYDGTWSLTGYLRMGGSVELLGLVSVAIELRLELGYDSGSNAMWGQARLVVSVDVTLTSFDLELDTGVWVFVGGSEPLPSRPASTSVARDDFRRNRSRLAIEELA